MNDATTDGYTATPAEIEGMLRNLCAYALSEPEPGQRYIELTHQQVLFDGLVAAIRRERGTALADLLIAGQTAEQVAASTKLGTATKVRALVTAAGENARVKEAETQARADAARARSVAVKARADAAKSQAAAARAAKSGKSGIVVPQAIVDAATDHAPMPPAPVSGKRTLTAAERVALGLPAEGAIPRTFGRRRKEHSRA
jgi:septal ring factor EnvC (AmiA/AmiB activator)